MRLIRRNLQTVYYALYASKTPNMDDYGRLTGGYTVNRTKPKAARMNVARATATAANRAVAEEYGIHERYAFLALTDDVRTAFDTDTVFWIGTTPKKNPKPNYIVTRVDRQLDSSGVVRLYLQEVDSR